MSQTEWSTIEPTKAEQEKVEYEIEGRAEQQAEAAAPEQKKLLHNKNNLKPPLRKLLNQKNQKNLKV